MSAVLLSGSLFCNSATVGPCFEANVISSDVPPGSTPQEVFCRDERLAYSEIVGYKVDSSMKWFTVTGLLPQVSGYVSTF